MTSSPQKQFENFSKVIDSYHLDLIPMVDVETRDKADAESFQKALQTFLDMVERRYGVVPMIYATNRTYNELCSGWLAPKYPLYIGRYSEKDPELKGSARYTIWQYSEKGKIDGINKETDLAAFREGRSLEDILWKRRMRVAVDTSHGLDIFTPVFSRIDLAVERMPSKDQDDIIFCCEAAFTGACLHDFKHFNIAGHHVSGGVFYPGYRCGANTGVFTWSPKSGYRFTLCNHKGSEPILKKVAAEGGMGFGQSMIVYDGKANSRPFSSGKSNRYRALCQMQDGRLSIVNSHNVQPFGDFVKSLIDIGVLNAIYCDMGAGWNYSWYRDDEGKAVEIFPTPGAYCTNWITFFEK